MSLGLRLLTVDCDGVENDDKDDCGIRIPYDDDDDILQISSRPVGVGLIGLIVVLETKQ